MLTKGLGNAKRDSSSSGSGSVLGGVGNAIDTSGLIAKVASNTQTAHFLSDTSLMIKLQELQQNPATINKHLGDPRIVQARAAVLTDPDPTAPGTGRTTPGRHAPSSRYDRTGPNQTWDRPDHTGPTRARACHLRVLPPRAVRARFPPRVQRPSSLANHTDTRPWAFSWV